MSLWVYESCFTGQQFLSRDVHLGIFLHNSTWLDCIIYFIPQAESYNSEICKTGPAVKSDIISYLLTLFKPTGFSVALKNMLRTSQFTVLDFYGKCKRLLWILFQVLLRNWFMCWVVKRNADFSHFPGSLSAAQSWKQNWLCESSLWKWNVCVSLQGYTVILHDLQTLLVLLKAVQN